MSYDYASFLLRAQDYTTKTFAYSDPEGLRHRSSPALKTQIATYQKMMLLFTLALGNSRYKMKVERLSCWRTSIRFWARHSKGIKAY